MQAESDSTVNKLTSKYAHLSDSDKGMVLYLVGQNRTQTEIAKMIGCSQSTISDFLQRVSNPAAVVQKVLKSHELKAAEHWAEASAVAAKRGDHRPARELIETANPELRPQQGNAGQSGGVTVIIGMPGAPVKLPDISIQASINHAQPTTSAARVGAALPAVNVLPESAGLSPSISHDLHSLTVDKRGS